MATVQGGQGLAADLPKPFWTNDPGLQEKLNQDQKILVSVSAKPKPGTRKHVLQMQGVGRVKAPFEYARAWAYELNHLKRVSDYVRQVRWAPEKKEFFFHTVAFDYHARMTLKVSREDKDQLRVIGFNIVEGVFRGLKGELRIEPSGFGASQVSIAAAHEYSEWPIPKLFLEFGREVVLEKFSERLRKLIETDFKTGSWVEKKQD